MSPKYIQPYISRQRNLEAWCYQWSSVHVIFHSCGHNCFWTITEVPFHSYTYGYESLNNFVFKSTWRAISKNWNKNKTKDFKVFHQDSPYKVLLILRPSTRVCMCEHTCIKQEKIFIKQCPLTITHFDIFYSIQPFFFWTYRSQKSLQDSLIILQPTAWKTDREHTVPILANIFVQNCIKKGLFRQNE